MRRHLRRANREDGSIMLALLLILIVSSLVVITTATAVTGLRKSQHARDFALAQQAADAAVNDALIWLNEQGYRDDPLGLPGTQATARTGTLDHITWSWYAETPLPGDSGYTLDIQAGRSDGSFTRHYVADLTGTEVPDGAPAVYLENGQPRYVVSPDAGFATGFFANREVLLGAATSVTSYDAGAGNTNSGNGRISSNGTISLDTGVTADQILLYNGTAQPYTERCVGGPCQTIPLRLEPIAYGVSDTCAPGTPNCTAPTKFITDKCASQTPRAWIASAEGRDLTAADNGVCFSSMVFDQPTTVTGPVEVYVTGDVTVAEGVTVNTTTAATMPDAAALRIYSQGAHVALHGGPAASSATRAAWLLWAPNADCASSGSGHVRVYGAMVCNRLTTTGTWELHVSEQALEQRNPADTTRARVWSLTRFSER